MSYNYIYYYLVLHAAINYLPLFLIYFTAVEVKHVAL